MRRVYVPLLSLLVPLVAIALALSLLPAAAKPPAVPSLGMAPAPAIEVALPASPAVQAGPAAPGDGDALAPASLEIAQPGGDALDVQARGDDPYVLDWGWVAPARDETEDEIPARVINRPPRPPAEIGWAVARDEARAYGVSSRVPVMPVPLHAPLPVAPDSPAPPTQAPQDSAAICAAPSPLLREAPAGAPLRPTPTAIGVPVYDLRASQYAIAEGSIHASGAPYSITLSPVHRNSDGNSVGYSSVFVFTNTSALAGAYVLDFYWPNGQYVGSEGPFNLDAGSSQVYAMSSAAFGETSFVGSVVIGGDQALDAAIASPEYGIIGGVVYQPDGMTPQQIQQLHLYRQWDNAWLGSTYNMGDGAFYLGGLPDGDAVLWVQAGYPWANQWYDGVMQGDQATWLTIAGANEVTIAVTLQAGGRITGTVYDRVSGMPLENVNVDIDQGGYGACTDAGGHYVIEGLPYGDYIVVAGRGWNWCLNRQTDWVYEYYPVTLDGADDTAQGIDFTLDPGGTISGTVYNNDHTQPLANINVDVEGGGYGTCTDESGRYAIAGLVHGDYRVRAGGGWNWCLDQQSIYAEEFYQESATPDLATTLTVSMTQLAWSGIDFTLDEGGKIVGRVTAEGGGPLENVRVDAWSYDTNEYNYQAWTDASGQYTITGLIDDDYRVGVTDWSWIPAGYAWLYYDGTYDWNEAARVPASAGTTTSGIDLALKPGGTITGWVRDEGGNPLPNQNVQAWVPDSPIGSGACSDENGYYEMRALPYGDYVVQGGGNWLCNGEPSWYAQEYWEDVQDWDQATPVPVNADTPNQTAIGFQLAPAGMLMGRVTDALDNPLSNTHVEIWMDGTSMGYGACTDDNGEYAMAGLTYGEWSVAAGGGWDPCQNAPSPYAREYYSGTHWFDQATPVLINGVYTTVAGIDLALDVGGSIAGRVTAHDTGAPLADVSVEVYEVQTGQGGTNAWTDAGGYYTVTGLLDGDYRVQITDQGSIPDGYAWMYYDGVFSESEATPVAVTIGATTGGIDLALKPGGTITGWVRDEGGNPLANISLGAWVPDSPIGTGTCTDENGYYEMRALPYGEYVVEAGGEWNHCTQEPGLYVREYYDNQLYWQDATLVLLDGDHPVVGDIIFGLAPGGRIMGRVTDAVGSPLPNVSVSTYIPDSPEGRGACTDENGDYAFYALPYGGYVVESGGWNGCQDQQSLYVREYYSATYRYDEATLVWIDDVITTATGIDLALDMGGAITGRVLDADTLDPLPGVRVDVREYGTDEWASEGWTDAGGYYTATGLIDGDYRVGVTDRGSIPPGYAWQFYNGTPDYEAAQPVHATIAGTTPGIDFALQPGGVIRGMVTDDEGAPLGNVSVGAGIPDSHMGTGTCTAADGSYELPNLPYGEYVVDAGGACDDDPERYAREYYPDTYDWDMAMPIPVNGDKETWEGIDFSLSPGGWIAGRVVDGLGNPLENVNVGAHMPGENWGNGACTAADGSYTIGTVPHGEYVVEAGKEDNWCTGEPSPYMTVYYSGTYRYEEATPVQVSDVVTTATGIDFTMQEGGAIAGRVTDAGSGDPLPGVLVAARTYDDEWYRRSTRTDADGYYTITGLIDWDYRVGVDWEIPEGYAQQYWPNTFAHHLAGRVNVSGGATVGGIDFALQPGGAITGVILDAGTGLPLANINVESGLRDGDGGRGVCSQEDGSFVLDGLMHGEYVVSAGGGYNHCQNRESEYVQKYWENTYRRDEATPVAVTGPEPVGGITITMDSGGYIAGRVVDNLAAPVEGLRVAAIVRTGDCPWCQDWIAGTDTNPNGDYLLGPLPHLDVAVYACADCNGQLLVNEYYSDVYHIQDATMVSATAGMTVTGIDFILDPGVWATGTVTVPGGYSPEGFQVDMWQEDPYGYGTSTRTDATGVYTMAVPPIYDSRWTVSLWPEGTDLGAQWAHDFDLSRHTRWDFDLGPGGAISGYVTSGGAPVEGAQVNADSAWWNGGTETGPDGYYEITNLPQGDYRVRAEKWEYMYVYYGGHEHDWAFQVPLDEGATYPDVDIAIQPLGRLEGHIYESDGVTPIEGVRVTAINEGGYWTGWTQPDGYYSIDLPAGEVKVEYQTQEWWARTHAFYGGVHTYRDSPWVTVPEYWPTETSLVLTATLEQMATLEGVVRDADKGDPVGGIHVSVLNVDPAIGLQVQYGTCTDGDGHYTIDKVWPGLNEVVAVGTCGASEYGLITDTFTAVAGAHHVLDLEVTAGTAPPRPFTIRTSDTGDYTPLSSGPVNYDQVADEILSALYAPLVALDDQGNWYSELLVQVPTVDNGGAEFIDGQLHVTYELLPGLLWSDGMPLTSADIAFTWQLLTQPDPNMQSYVAQIHPLWRVERIETPDPQTAVLIYRRGASPPAYLEAVRYLMPAHVLSGEHRIDVRWDSAFAHYPVGNGPYVVVDWVPGSHIDLIANPNYHARGEGLPVIQQVRFLFTHHPSYALLAGAADVATEVDPAIYGGLNVPTVSRATNLFRSIVPNTDLPFFADAAVRRALYYALDREQSARDYGPTHTIADAYLPPGHPMHGGAIVTYTHDLAMAASLLDAAGWVDTNANGIRDKDGVEFEFDLVYPDGSVERQKLGTMWQSDLAAIGVDLNVVPMPWNELLDGARRGELDAYTMGWIFDSIYDPMAWSLYHSRAVPSAYNSYWGGTHQNHWADPDPTKTDAWLWAARTEIDHDALRSLYAQHLERFSDQLPTWVYNHGVRVDAYSPVVLNISPGQATPLTWNIAEWQLVANPWDVAVRKALAVDSPAPQPGATITYELRVRNYGSLTTHNVVLLDTLPGDLAFVSATPPASSQAGNTLRWNLGDLGGRTSAGVVRVAAQVLPTITHGTLVTNVVEVYADEADTYPGNNGYVHVAEVREDVDIAVTKAGVGQAAVGAEYLYLIDYANWGGAPAAGAVVTDVLPPEVLYREATPAPDAMDGQVLTWTLPTLLGNQWGGQIQIVTEVTSTGTVVNTAYIAFPGDDAEPGNNSDGHSEQVDEILAPIITQPTQGTTNLDPTFRGLAPALSTIDFWDLSETPAAVGQGAAAAELSGTWVASTTASIDGAFELVIPLQEGAYIIVATATKAGLTSDQSNASTIVVADGLLLDTDLVRISSDGVDISRGVVRAERRTLSYRMLDIEMVLPCTTLSDVYLWVTENGVFSYRVPAVEMTELGAGEWLVRFRLWLAGEPHSTYNIRAQWKCDGAPREEALLYILIDPDGFLYDQSMVDAGSPITDALILDGTVTCYEWQADHWAVWPAALYGQVNPQVTDDTTDDGVIVAGYYSFLTPPGQYRIVASADGYQPYQSAVLTVIDTPIHLDIGLQPIAGGAGHVQTPAELAGSHKKVDLGEAWVGDKLTYKIELVNGGEIDTGELTLSDPIPDRTSYVAGSVTSSDGGATYNASGNAIVWTGVVPAKQQVAISFEVLIVGAPGAPYNIENRAEVDGPPENLSSLPDLVAWTYVQDQAGVDLGPDLAQYANPGEAVVYEHTLQNTGNVEDTYSLSASSSQGWSVVAPGEITLAPGATTTVAVEVQVPLGAISGTVDTTTVTATSAISEAFHDTATAETTVRQAGQLSLSPNRAAVGLPGETVPYAHNLVNLGNATDTFTITAHSSQGWSVSAPQTLTLEAGLSTTLLVEVAVPAGELAGVVDTTVVTATSHADPAAADAVHDVTTVGAVAAFSLEGAAPQEVDAGRVVTYQHTLRNDGNGVDKFMLSVSSSEGWTVSASADPLLSPGESTVVEVYVHVPSEATGGTVDTTTLTVTSKTDTAVQHTVEDVTTVAVSEVKVYLPVILRAQ
ncbi:MAG: carboxypeptidase regulatory-like domain-containing protein [Anaerolineae bacterium]|nr:carboxypeptidase regulatory-like domain-containing protein [Anaerolineae bacterium]